MELFDILSALAGARGPSGFETRAAERARSLLAPLADETWQDNMGSLFGLLRSGRPNAGTVLLDAHLDEVGFLITGAESGFYRFRALGSVDPRLWPGAELQILTDPPAQAVVACLPPHLLEKGMENTAVKPEDLFIDTGGFAVPPGSPGVFAQKFQKLGGLVSGCALDDRAGFAVLLWALQDISRDSISYDILVCGSAQEEVGTRGAAVAAHGRHPDYAVAVDVTYGESPGSKEDTFPLGGGVCINRGPDCSRALTESLVALAREKEIPYQIEVTCGMSRTNATPLQISGAGIPTAVLSVPLRYMHTPVETLCLGDMEAAGRLLREWVAAL